MKASWHAEHWAALILVAFLAACATWRWSGTRAPGDRPPSAALRSVAADEAARPAPQTDAAAEDAAAVSVSTYPARVALPAVPKAPEDRRRNALFYSDLGPDTIDVSSYPSQQRYNYQVYARECGRCHTLARSNNAPYVGRGWWEFYMLGMRVRSRRSGRPLPPDDVKAILDFLEYDSRARKIDRAHEFDAQTEELKRRFNESVSERMRRMQQANPRLGPRDR